MVASKVIVFGPTGAVGSSAARTAHSLGSHVVLAMRNTSKPIPGLSAASESSGNYSRVSADLTKPESISAAVTQTGAKHAFMYVAHGSTDWMRGTIEALKGSGIELVVFLSSFSVSGDIRQIQKEDIIPWAHAQVEIGLHDIFGQGNFVALRPGSFASNHARYLADINAGEVKVRRPDARVDNIVPEDIGRVAGTVLVKGVPEDGNTTPYILGPKLYRQDESVQILAKALGKSPVVKDATEEETRKTLIEERHVPAPAVEYMLRQLAKTEQGGKASVFGIPVEEQWLGNVERYTGSQPTSFEQWVETNKHQLA